MIVGIATDVRWATKHKKAEFRGNEFRQFVFAMFTKHLIKHDWNEDIRPKHSSKVIARPNCIIIIKFEEFGTSYFVCLQQVEYSHQLSSRSFFTESFNTSCRNSSLKLKMQLDTSFFRLKNCLCLFQGDLF